MYRLGFSHLFTSYICSGFNGQLTWSARLGIVLNQQTLSWICTMFSVENPHFYLAPGLASAQASLYVHHSVLARHQPFATRRVYRHIFNKSRGYTFFLFLDISQIQTPINYPAERNHPQVSTIWNSPVTRCGNVHAEHNFCF